jgi:anhydro-N-acetylmuramic acid kinase
MNAPGAQSEAAARPLTALGLMSGTSTDGVDAALVRSDGIKVENLGRWLTRPYPADLRQRLRAVLGGRGEVEAVAREVTLAHAQATRELLEINSLTSSAIDIIGFHGHTILHAPEARRSWQIGDGALLARLTGIDVVCDLRAADVAAGGEGAPLAPLYHQALSRGLEAPLAVLNLGGVGNVTWIGADGALIAFDTGPGNAMIDDWVRAHGAGDFDRDGAMAAAGTVVAGRLAALLAHVYFERTPPKSLDRDAFGSPDLAGLSPADGAATLAAFTVEAVVRGLKHLPARPKRWLVTGGGRHNATLMRLLGERLAAPVEPVEAAGWRGDALEAEAFGFLAVRSLRGLPLSLPSTTGVPRPMPGGVLHRRPRA